MIKHIESVKEFDELIKNGVVMVDFYADWCGPCRMLSPIIEEVANEFEGKDVIIAKLNVDKVEEIAARYGVFTIPTVLFFKSEQVSEKLVGYRPKDHFIKILTKM